MLEVGSLPAAAPAPCRLTQEITRSARTPPDDQRRKRHWCPMPTLDVPTPNPKPGRCLAHLGDRGIGRGGRTDGRQALADREACCCRGKQRRCIGEHGRGRRGRVPQGGLWRPCSRSKRLAANGGTRLVTRLAPVSLDGGVRPGRRVGLVRHFIQCVFNSLPTMLKPLSLVVLRYEHWLTNN